MLKFSNIVIESIIIYFDQSIILYTSITIAIIVGIIQILYKWYSRKGVCIQYIYNINIEIIWTILPILFIIFMLIHSIPVIYNLEVNKGISSSYTSVIGSQWYWIYNSIESRISSIGRIILVDQPLFLNSNIVNTLLISSLDVIHSFSIPSLGIKVDAIPGRINSISINSLISGLYIGYCSELCGSGHAFMPINLVVYNSSNSFNSICINIFNKFNNVIICLCSVIMYMLILFSCGVISMIISSGSILLLLILGIGYISNSNIILCYSIFYNTGV